MAKNLQENSQQAYDYRLAGATSNLYLTETKRLVQVMVKQTLAVSGKKEWQEGKRMKECFGSQFSCRLGCACFEETTTTTLVSFLSCLSLDLSIQTSHFQPQLSPAR